MDNKNIIISLGGSVIVPNELDTDFVIKFKDLVTGWVRNGYKFFIITGGGKVCRNYNDSLKKVIDPSNDDLDWLGIATTRLNAEFIRICFGDLAYEKVIMDPSVLPETEKSVMVGGGWKPGNSSDLAAVYMAESAKSNIVVNISSVDSVYDSDPAKNPNAKKIENISWHAYRSIISSEWDPGMNLPFDPVASKKAEELGLELVFIGGHNLESLNNYLNGQPFTGTTIK